MRGCGFWVVGSGVGVLGWELGVEGLEVEGFKGSGVERISLVFHLLLGIEMITYRL